VDQHRDLRPWHPGAHSGAVVEERTAAIEPLITERKPLTR
jgi:hypothetical protein